MAQASWPGPVQSLHSILLGNPLCEIMWARAGGDLGGARGDVDKQSCGAPLAACRETSFNSIVDHLICVVDQFYSRSLYLFISCSNGYYVWEYISFYEGIDPVGPWGKCLARGERLINVRQRAVLPPPGSLRSLGFPHSGSATDLGSTGSSMSLWAAGPMGIIQRVYEYMNTYKLSPKDRIYHSPLSRSLVTIDLVGATFTTESLAF